MGQGAGVKLEALPKGYEFAPSSFFVLSREWVKEYIGAVEDEAIGNLGSELVPPMAVAALAVRALLESARLPEGAIHLGQDLEFQRPVRVGERLSVQAHIASRGERQGWVLLGIDLDINDEGGSPVMAGRATLTMPGQ